MRKLFKNFHIFHFQKRIVSAETVRGNTVFQNFIFFNFVLKPPGLPDLAQSLTGSAQNNFEYVSSCYLVVLHIFFIYVLGIEIP